METLRIALQLTIALAIVNVWIFRKDKASKWRGANADNLEEEFEAYGLNKALMIITGALKLVCAALLVIGIWIPILATYAAAGLALLLLLALLAHFKVHDPAQKSLPAATLLALSTAVILL